MTYILTERLHGDLEGKLHIIAESKSPYALRKRRAEIIKARSISHALKRVTWTSADSVDFEIWKRVPRAWADLALEREAERRRA